METEILATSAVKKRIAQTKYLSPFINEGDKEPSWDGFIYAYEDASKKKEKLVGRAAVQVKGLQRKDLRKKSISYAMDIVDLENYRTDGGIILFVVCIGTDLQEQIYYSSLTPFYLNEILSVSVHGKRKARVHLRKLPDDSDELCNIVFNFLRDSKRQSIVRNGHIWTLEEAAEFLGRDNIEYNFSYTGIGYDKNDPFSFLSKNEIYMYAQNKEETITIPLHHVEHIDLQVSKRIARISVGAIDYNETISLTQHRDGKVILGIGKSLMFVSEKDKSVFKYELCGNLDEQIRAIETLLEMIKRGYIYVDSSRLNISPNKEELKRFNLLEWKNQLKYYRLIKDTLNRLNVKRSLEIEMLTEKEANNLWMLINAVNFGKTVSFKENKIPIVSTISFANLRIVLTFNRQEDGRYLVEDFFNANMVCVIDKKIEYATTPFCLLCKDDFLQDDNLVLDKVIEEFEKYENVAHLEKMVMCILEMIKAYDIDESRKELLEGARELCAWMMDKEPQNIIHRINFLQCCFRERQLTSEELDELSTIIINCNEDVAIQAGVHILLGSKNLAKKCISMLNDEQRNEFYTYPIYTLYERM